MRFNLLITYFCILINLFAWFRLIYPLLVHISHNRRATWTPAWARNGGSKAWRRSYKTTRSTSRNKGKSKMVCAVLAYIHTYFGTCRHVCTRVRTYVRVYSIALWYPLGSGRQTSPYRHPDIRNWISWYSLVFRSSCTYNILLVHPLQHPSIDFTNSFTWLMSRYVFNSNWSSNFITPVAHLGRLQPKQDSSYVCIVRTV